MIHFKIIRVRDGSGQRPLLPGRGRGPDQEDSGPGGTPRVEENGD